MCQICFEDCKFRSTRTHHIEDGLAVNYGRPTLVLYLPMDDDTLPRHVARPLHHPVYRHRARYTASPDRLIFAYLYPTLQNIT